MESTLSLPGTPLMCSTRVNPGLVTLPKCLSLQHCSLEVLDNMLYSLELVAVVIAFGDLSSEDIIHCRFLLCCPAQYLLGVFCGLVTMSISGVFGL